MASYVDWTLKGVQPGDLPSGWDHPVIEFHCVRIVPEPSAANGHQWTQESHGRLGEVRIGEAGNRAVLKKEEWNVLVDLIQSGQLGRV